MGTTAGFILSGKAGNAMLSEENGTPIIWGVRQYFRYGVINYLIQISIALVVILIVL